MGLSPQDLLDVTSVSDEKVIGRASIYGGEWRFAPHEQFASVFGGVTLSKKKTTESLK